MNRFDVQARTATAAAAVAAYGAALSCRGWPRDDRWLILEHPLIRAGGSGAFRLLTSGYVQPLVGARTPIHEWRPILSLSFLLQRITTGFSPLPLHAVNLILHVAVCLLAFESLRRRIETRAAAAGAIFFSVLPIHAEVVAYLTSRSELLAAASVLSAWILLGSPRRPSPRALATGAAIYLVGSLSKEHCLLFPLFLTLSDWVFAGDLPWKPPRRPVYIALLLAASVVMIGRAIVLPAVAHGGHPYFQNVSYLTRLLTLSRFWAWFYVRPAASGIGLCADFSRPLIPDSSATDIGAWIALLGLCATVAAGIEALRNRKQWSFWLFAPTLFLIPTSHLVIDLDTLGAQRFLYLPSLGLAVGVGSLFNRTEARFPRAARAVYAGFVLWLIARSFLRTQDWRDDLAYYRATVTCNPVSAKARVGLGLARLRRGDSTQGRRDLEEALAMAPDDFEAPMNLAKIAFDQGDWARSRRYADQALSAQPDAADALTLSALLHERAGSWGRSAAELKRAVESNPMDPTARFNYSRALAAAGDASGAAAEVRSYLRLVPAGPEAKDAEEWLRALEQRPAHRQ